MGKKKKPDNMIHVFWLHPAGSCHNDFYRADLFSIQRAHSGGGQIDLYSNNGEYVGGAIYDRLIRVRWGTAIPKRKKRKARST